MRIIGITGLSGAGKDTAAMLLVRELSLLGVRVGTDRFAMPIKWLCRKRGWKGEATPEWRAEMQRLAVVARETPDWWASHADLFHDDGDFRHMEMSRRETIARDWNHDKFVFWLASRNGLCVDHATGGWYEPLMPAFHCRPDVLVVPDVRYPAEADFCQDMGMLVGLVGTRVPLSGLFAAHVSESHIPALLERADYTVHHEFDVRPHLKAVAEMAMAGDCFRMFQSFREKRDGKDRAD